MDLIKKLENEFNKIGDPLYFESLEYIRKLLSENKNLQTEIENLIPEKKYLPFISGKTGQIDDYGLSDYFYICPRHDLSGYAAYRKIADYTESLTDDYFLFSESSHSCRVTLQFVKSSNIKNKFLFVIDFRDVVIKGSDNIHTTMKKQIKELMKYKLLAEQKNKKFIILISAPFEAPSYRYNLKEYCDYLEKFVKIPLNNIIILSGAMHQFGDPVKFSVCYSAAFPDMIFENFNSNSKPEYHFISLARIAKAHRVLASIEILDRDLKKYGNMSLGSGYYHSDDENADLWNLIPDRYRKMMPLIIDGIIAKKDDHKQHRAVDKRFNNSFINYVMETSFEQEVTPQTWNAPFVTEKSIKPFAWGQVPIFLTPFDTLKHIRNLGFDLFDDIIDHGYDMERDPSKRIKMTVDQLEKICKWSIEDCQQFKKDNIERFSKNREISDYLRTIYLPQINVTNLQLTLDSYDL